MPQDVMETKAKKAKAKVKKAKGRTPGSGQPCRNWVLAAKEPIMGLEETLEQMLMAAKYQNKLCELELLRRQGCDQVLRDFAPTVGQLEAKVKEAEDAFEITRTLIKSQNRKAKSRVNDPGLKNRAKDEREVLSAARKQLRELKKATYALPEVKERLLATSEAHKQAIRDARKSSGLYSGTYQIVEDAAKTMGQGPPPKFRSFDGNGRVSVQIVNGVLWSQIESGEGAKTLLQLKEPAPERPNWVLLYFRVKSETKGGPPLWCVLPVRLTRPIPPDALVKRVTVHRKVTGKELYVNKKRHRHGGGISWSVMLTLQRPAWPKLDCATEGTVAVNFGYRRVTAGVEGSEATGLRVAQSVAEDGSKDTLVIPQAWLDRLDKADAIQSDRDIAVDKIRAAILEFKQNWASRKMCADKEIPEWFRVATKELHLWKSPAGFAHLIINWRDNRFAGDACMFPVAEEWRRRDSHLGRYANGLRKRFRNRRQYLFRMWACFLRRKYKTLVIGDLDLKQLGRKPQPEEDADLVSAQREALRRASVGELRNCLKHSMMVTVELESAFTTQTCHVCSMREKFNAAKQIWHTCSQCGAEWDQDANNCENLLASYKEDPTNIKKEKPKKLSTETDDAVDAMPEL